MLEETLFTIDMPYRQSMAVKAYSFGVDSQGRVLGGDDPADPADFEKAACFVGSMRGNEVQQTFICARLVRKLRSIEQNGGLVPGKRIMIVPCVNPASINTGMRFWVGDNTDVNRMMPGYDQGETTQRIADALFSAVKGYTYGVHFSSFHLDGDFLDHIRVMTGVGIQSNNGADFGQAYVLRHVPGSFDTTTLHYNWRLWDTEAYTFYTRRTSIIDQDLAKAAARGCLRFLHERGVICYPSHAGYRSTLLNERQLIPTQSPCGGVFLRKVQLGDIVSRGQIIAEVADPLTGETRAEICAPRGGVVFYVCRSPLVNEQTLVFQIVPRDVRIGADDTARGNFLDPEA